jgi:hypothetical protein
MSKNHIVVAQNKLDYRMTLSLQMIPVQPRSACAQGCHIGRLSRKSRPKDVVRARSDVPTFGRTSESADRRRMAPGGQPKRTASPAAERTATLQKNSQEHHNIL